MLPLGTRAPSFELKDVTTGKMISLETFQGKKGLLVMFICRHCPYVVHIRFELAKLGHDYVKKNLGVVAISSNDAKAYPDDAPSQLRQMAEELQFEFPFCYDESQEVAKAYTAACTPDFFLFDEQHKLVYRGQLDGSRPGNDVEVNGADLRRAIGALLDGRAIESEQTPSLGCNIKWKPGNEPGYFG